MFGKTFSYITNIRKILFYAYIGVLGVLYYTNYLYIHIYDEVTKLTGEKRDFLAAYISFDIKFILCIIS